MHLCRFPSRMSCTLLGTASAMPSPHAIIPSSQTLPGLPAQCERSVARPHSMIGMACVRNRSAQRRGINPSTKRGPHLWFNVPPLSLHVFPSPLNPGLPWQFLSIFWVRSRESQAPSFFDRIPYHGSSDRCEENIVLIFLVALLTPQEALGAHRSSRLEIEIVPRFC